jgi:hypothetical protein
MQSSFLIGTRASLTLMMMMMIAAMMDASFTFGVNWTSSSTKFHLKSSLEEIY